MTEKSLQPPGENLPRAPAPRIRHWLLVSAAAILPFLFLTLYLLFSRWPKYRFTETTDFIALGMGVLSAAICIWLIRVKLWWRLLALVAILPALSFGLLMYALTFVCGVFDECL